MMVRVPQDRTFVYQTLTEDTPFGPIHVPFQTVIFEGRHFRLLVPDRKLGTCPAIDLTTGRRVHLLFEGMT